MTDEAALAVFPEAKGFMEVTGPPRPFGIVVDKSGTAWAFDGDIAPRPLVLGELKAFGARPCKPSDAVELIPASMWPVLDSGTPSG